MLWIDLWWNLKLRAVVSSLKLKRDLNVTVVVEPKRLMRKQKLNGITHKNNCKYLRKISRNAFAKALFHYFSHLTPLPKFSLLVTPFFITFLESQHFWPIFLQGVSFRACFFWIHTLQLEIIVIISPWPQHEAWETSVYEKVLPWHLATWRPHAVAYGWLKKSNGVYLAGIPLDHPSFLLWGIELFVLYPFIFSGRVE